MGGCSIVILSNSECNKCEGEIRQYGEVLEVKDPGFHRLFCYHLYVCVYVCFNELREWIVGLLCDSLSESECHNLFLPNSDIMSYSVIIKYWCYL